MKKWIAFILTAVAVMGLWGCEKPARQTAQEATAEISIDGSIPPVDTFSVGYARVDITPSEPVPISGAASNSTDRMSQTVHDDLELTCIAITDENNKTVLFFTFDLQRPDVNIFEYVALALEQQTGLSEEYMYFTATHTHSGPDTYDSDFPAIVNYKNYVLQQGVEAGIQALKNRQPAQIYYSTAETERMNAVRHYTRVDDNGELIYFGDQYHINQAVYDGRTQHIKEPDTTMHIIRFDRENDKDVVLVNWRAHPHLFTSASSFKLSADFVGAFRTSLESMYDCNFAYFQGAAGNVNATSKISGELQTRDYGEYGRIMAEYVVQALKNETKLTGTTIQTRQNQRVFEQNHTTDHLLAYAKICRQMWKNGASNAEATAYGETYGIDGPVAAGSIINRAAAGETITSELNAVVIGQDLCIVTAPHELFDTNSEWLEENAPYPYTLTFGYTNGMNGYVPSAAAFEYGCYEANCTNLLPGSGEVIQQEFLTMLEEMAQ